MPKKPASVLTFYTILGFSLAGYIFLGYFTQRTNFIQFIILFGLLITGYIFINITNPDESLIKKGIVISVLFRFSLLLMLPNLSDDYFRFIWDGRLFAHGINPFTVMPSSFIRSDEALSTGLGQDLFSSMNSQEYYTIYPPVLQFIFRLSTILFPTNILGAVVIMRLIIIAAEAGSIFLLDSILRKLQLPLKNVLLYALNPLVIIELSGNLHFEALMIFFLLLSVHLLWRKQLIIAAFIFALAVCSKLLPLMFLPLLIKQIGIKKSIQFYLICGISCILLFAPFVDRQFLSDISSSLQLYFQKFEFNASIFYIIRWIGFQTHGYDVIGISGILLSFITTAAIIIFSAFQKRKGIVPFFNGMLFCITSYFIFTTTVHPWYITTLVALCTVTTIRFPLVWSGLIVLTYFAYRSVPYSESMLIVATEYFFLFLYMLYEWKMAGRGSLKSYSS